MQPSPPNESVHDGLPVAAYYVAPDYFVPMGWATLLLGGCAAFASFWIAGEFNSYSPRPEGGLLGVVLNPLAWTAVIGCVLLGRASQSGSALRCPQCRKVVSPDPFMKRPRRGGAVWTCPRCSAQFAHPPLSTVETGDAPAPQRPEASRSEATGSNPGYTDEECEYLGTDPRLVEPGTCRAASVSVTPSGFLLQVTRVGAKPETMHYPLALLQTMRSKSETWIAPRISRLAQSSTDRNITDECVNVYSDDPEGILTEPVLLSLRFRNAYHAQVFALRAEKQLRLDRLAKVSLVEVSPERSVQSLGDGNVATPPTVVLPLEPFQQGLELE
jgi:hypothetical protein